MVVHKACTNEDFSCPFLSCPFLSCPFLRTRLAAGEPGYVVEMNGSRGPWRGAAPTDDCEPNQPSLRA